MGVARLQPEKHVEHASQGRVAYVTVAPGHRARLDLAAKPRAQDVISPASLDRADQVCELGEVVAIVRVTHDDNSAASLGKTCSVSIPVAPLRLLDDSRPSLAGNIGRTVPRAVVDNKHLADHARKPDPLEGFGDADPDALRLVQTRHDD